MQMIMETEKDKQEIDKFIRQMSYTRAYDHLSKSFKANPLTLYVSTFIADDGKKKGCVYTVRPRKGVVKFWSFTTSGSDTAVDKVAAFLKRNGVTEYKLIQ